MTTKSGEVPPSAVELPHPIVEARHVCRASAARGAGAAGAVQAEGVQQAAHHEVELVHQAMARKAERDWGNLIFD